jgi:hypothetical protein
VGVDENAPKHKVIVLSEMTIEIIKPTIDSYNLGYKDAQSDSDGQLPIRTSCAFVEYSSRVAAKLPFCLSYYFCTQVLRLK